MISDQGAQGRLVRVSAGAGLAVVVMYLLPKLAPLGFLGTYAFIFQGQPSGARELPAWGVRQILTGAGAEENPELESPPTAGAVAKAIRRTAAMIELD